MQSSHLLRAAAICMIAAGLAIVAGRFASAQPTAVAPPTSAEIVRARQAAYEMSVITFSQLKRAADAGSDVTKQKFAADALAEWAVALPTLFPDGTGADRTSVATAVKPEVWSNRTAFITRANEFKAATARLVDLAKSGDASGFAAQVEAVKKSCDACHADFKNR